MYKVTTKNDNSVEYYTNHYSFNLEVCEVENLLHIAEKNLTKLKERLPETFTRQYRDFASDCPVRPSKGFNNVQYGTIRDSGHVTGILANTETDEYYQFTWNDNELYNLTHSFEAKEFNPEIKKGFKDFCERAEKGYSRNY